MWNWIKNLFKRRYIDISRIDFIKKKGITPLF